MMQQNALSANCTKMGGVVDTPKCCAAIQGDLEGLEKWANRNLMKFIKRNCKVLHLGRKHPVQKCLMGFTQLETAWLMASWAALKQSIPNRLKEVIVPFCPALVRPYLEYCVHFWAPLYRRDMDIMERVR